MNVWWGVIGAAFVLSAVLSCLVTALMRKLSPQWGLVDRPNARKVHLVPTPLGGGLGIAVGILIPLGGISLLAWIMTRVPALADLLPPELRQHLSGINSKSGQVWSILLGGALLTVMGLLDDLKNLKWQPKLLIQFLVAGGMVGAGFHLTVLLPVPWVGELLTLFWIVILTNAFNFLDNMDGLSGGIGWIASILFSILMLTGTSDPRWFVAGMLVILAGSLTGFLIHNWPPARIFMGDAGSCLIGFLLAVLTVSGTFYDYEQNHPHVLLAPLCILAVPLYDFCSVVLIRLSQGRSPFHADKNHFSHRLVEMGLSKPNAVLTIHLVTLTTGLGGLLLYHVPDWSGAGLIVASELCLLAIVWVLEQTGRRSLREQAAQSSSAAAAAPAATSLALESHSAEGSQSAKEDA